MLAVALLPAAASALEVDAPCSNSAVIMSYGERALCSISAGTDIDVYKFAGSAGDLVRVVIDGLNYDFDPKLELFGPSGAPYPSTSCNSTYNTTCSAARTWQLQENGLYTLLVSDAGTNNTGNYALDLQVLPPQVHVPILGYGQTLTVAINHGSDSDWLRFDGLRGDRVILAVNGLNYDLDPRIQVMDPSGTIWWLDLSCNSTYNTTCSFTSGVLTLPDDGTYYIAVLDNGWDNTGSLNVSLTCVLGTCPTISAPISLGTPYCSSTPNSTGVAATMDVIGSADVASNDVEVLVRDVPPGQWGIVFMGATAGPGIPISGSQGSLCMSQSTPIVRLATVLSNNANQMRRFLDLNSNLMVGHVLPGSTWNFQAWFRDSNPGPTTNTSDGMSVLFQ